MGITTITRKLEFDAGHRVLGHEGKCRHLHGHRYVAELEVSASEYLKSQGTELDECSRVIDFSVLKSVVGGWVDEHWDHNLLLNENDPLWLLCQAAMEVSDSLPVLGSNALEIFQGKQPYIVQGGENPTAEVLARLLFQKAEELLKPYDIRVMCIRMYETPNCWAEYSEVYGC